MSPVHTLPPRSGAAPAVQAAPAAGPRARRRGPQVATVACPNCGQQIPSDEFEAHIRIELQDPKWREQKAKSDARFSTTNLHAVDVANNLKRLASHREDIFDPATGEPISEEELARRKRAAIVVQAPDQDEVGRTVKVPMGQSMDINEQIKNIQAKYRQGQGQGQ
jgi:splicing factor 3A subunit 1